MTYRYIALGLVAVVGILLIVSACAKKENQNQTAAPGTATAAPAGTPAGPAGRPG